MRNLTIIPCFNEEKRLKKERFKEFIGGSEGIDFLFVNDGSLDNTLDGLLEIKKEHPNRVEVLDLKKNGGKGEAIRQGMLNSVDLGYDYIGYFDADLATPLDEIPRLLGYTERTLPPFIVMGSRIKLLGSTNIQRKLRRHYIGRVFATIVSNMLQLPIYDTQCGAKLIHNEIISTVFKEPFSSKWLFDVCLLYTSPSPRDS